MGYAFIRSMRPRQWTKNLILFAGLIFSKHLFFFPFLLKTSLAFLLFCFISGTVYIINDVFDLESDRKHPLKSKRPIASGELKPFWAILFAALIALFSLGASFFLHLLFGLTAFSYFLLMFFYSCFLIRLFHLAIPLSAN